MHKKFDINWTKIKGGCLSGRKVVTHNSKLPLKILAFFSMQIIEVFEEFFNFWNSVWYLSTNASAFDQKDRPQSTTEIFLFHFKPDESSQKISR